MAASKKEAERIQHAARELLASDANLRTLSWNRILEIAEALSVKKLRGSERRAYARELRLIAATNLEVAARLKGADEHRALQAIAEGPADEKAERADSAAGQAARRTANDEAVSYQMTEVPPADQVESSEAASAGRASSGRGASHASTLDDGAAVGDRAGEDRTGAMVDPTAAGDRAASAEDEGWHQHSGSVSDDSDTAGRHDGQTTAVSNEAGKVAADGERENTVTADAAVDDPTASGEAPSERDASVAASSEADAAPADPNYDEKGRWIGDTAPVNIVQMINAEMVYQSDDEDDKDRHAAAAAQASLYDDPVSVVLPSADELDAMLPTIDEMVEVENEELKREVEAEHTEYASAKLSDHDRTPVAEKGAPGAPGTGGAKPADPKPAEGEPSISFGFSEHSRAERAILADKQKKEAKKARKKGAGADRGNDADHKSSGRKHRFSFFGRHNTEDMPVIPRGKSDFAPDDLFVIDKHRAAQAKEREADKRRAAEAARSKAAAEAEAKEAARTDAEAANTRDAEVAGTSPADGVKVPDAKASSAQQGDETPSNQRSSTADNTASLNPEHAPAHRPEHARPASEESDSSSAAAGHADAPQVDRVRERREPATFELLHLSSGGRVGFYQDADGHITAVDTARFV